jgi:hypothetical protein
MATSTATAIKIELPPLHSGGQQLIAMSPARFKVVMCGRRYGKTTLGVWLCVKSAINGGRAWWVAPTYKIAKEGWIILKRLANQLRTINNNALGVEVREGDMMVNFNAVDGSIEIRSSDTEDGLRGAGLDFVVMDEAASQRESAWTEELRPALMDKRGSALFIGTPKGNNWFAKYWARASTNDRANWAAWKYTSYDNPLITAEEKTELEEEYAGRPDKYAQEILADIGASQYLVYPTFNREVHMWKWPIPKIDVFLGGLDFGGDQIGAHKSAGIAAGYIESIDTILLMREFEESGPNITERQTNWVGETEAVFKMMAKKHRNNPPFYWAGDRSQQRYIDILRSYGHRIIPSKGGTGSVRAGIDLISSRLEVREASIGMQKLFGVSQMPRLFYLPELTQFPHRMENYHNYEPKDDEDAVQKDNPVKVNDDLMDAFRYLVERKDGRVMGDPNVIYKNQLIGGSRGR